MQILTTKWKMTKLINYKLIFVCIFVKRLTSDSCFSHRKIPKQTTSWILLNRKEFDSSGIEPLIDWVKSERFTTLLWCLNFFCTPAETDYTVPLLHIWTDGLLKLRDNASCISHRKFWKHFIINQRHVGRKFHLYFWSSFKNFL